MDQTKRSRHASSALLSKTRMQHRQKSPGAESPPHARASARSNPDSRSSHDRRSKERCRRISQRKRSTACPERKSNGSNPELKARTADRNSSLDSPLRNAVE